MGWICKSPSEMERITVDICAANKEGNKMIVEFSRFLRQKGVEFVLNAKLHESFDTNIVVYYSVSGRTGIIYEGNELSNAKFESMYRKMIKMRVD